MTNVNITHTRTVVRECCKDDDQSQWGRVKFDPRRPQIPYPVITKIFIGDYVGGTYHHAKYYPDRIRGFVSAHAWLCALKWFTRLLFWVLPLTLSQDACTDFHAKYLKRRGSTQGCAFWGSQNLNLKFRPFLPKTTIFGELKFSLKNRLMVNIYSHQTPQDTS